MTAAPPLFAQKSHAHKVTKYNNCTRTKYVGDLKITIKMTHTHFKHFRIDFKISL